MEGEIRLKKMMSYRRSRSYTRELHKVSLDQISQETLQHVTKHLLAYSRKAKIKQNSFEKNKTKTRTLGSKDRDGRKSSAGTQPPLLPAQQWKGLMDPSFALPSPSDPSKALGSGRGHIPPDLPHAGLSWSKLHCRFSAKWKTLHIQRQLRQNRNKQRGCKSSTHSSFIWESFPAFSSHLGQGITPQ